MVHRSLGETTNNLYSAGSLHREQTCERNKQVINFILACLHWLVITFWVPPMSTSKIERVVRLTAFDIMLNEIESDWLNGNHCCQVTNKWNIYKRMVGSHQQEVTFKYFNFKVVQATLCLQQQHTKIHAFIFIRTIL